MYMQVYIILERLIIVAHYMHVGVYTWDFALYRLIEKTCHGLYLLQAEDTEAGESWMHLEIVILLHSRNWLQCSICMRPQTIYVPMVSSSFCTYCSA